MKETLLNKIIENIVILDGATGTRMQQKGMPQGVCPEQWACNNKEILESVHREYVKAGSDIIYTFTFGANKIKLEEYGLEAKTKELNKELAQIAKRAAGNEAYVAGDISPTGKSIVPIGELSFEEAVNNYKEQVEGLLEGGVDLFVIETMMDITEARAAILAVKESCDLPVFVSMTFQENMKTLSGTNPVSALVTLQSLGADVVGCNCSTGPDDMVKVIEAMKPYAKVPLMAKPNAGLPALVDGDTVFDMDSDEFVECMPKLIKAGANIVGGCCGTNAEYIQKLSEVCRDEKVNVIATEKISVLSSSTSYQEVEQYSPVLVVGEKINPTGKKKLQEELRSNRFGIVREFAINQVNAGANILDVNVGVNGIDEAEVMCSAINVISNIVGVPLCIDSSDPKVIEEALRIYPGRALVNSVSYEEHKIKELLPVVAKYGAMFIALPLDDNGIPKTLEDKKGIVNNIIEEAKKLGIDKSSIVVDALVMTVSSQQDYAKNTLETIRWCSDELGVKTIVGLSNISFGLPERRFVNSALFAMAIQNGLTMAITNPMDDMLMGVKMAADTIVSNDKNSRNYIEHFRKERSQETVKSQEKTKQLDEINYVDRVYNTVLNGNKDNIVPIIKDALDNSIKPGYLINDVLIKAITKVGELFEEGTYFLPQLILSAEAMKKGVEYLEPLLDTSEEGDNKKDKIILATVKGDIHDIGKNIVALLMKNYGFDVIDLGKDVEADIIIETAKRENVKLIGLSALMTTTMMNMKDVIDIIKKEELDIKVIIGGAVITQQFADEIGADGYSKDANDAVKLAKRLLS